MRRLVYVEGLNPRYRRAESNESLVAEENYLKINEECISGIFGHLNVRNDTLEFTALYAKDNAPCQAVWRYDTKGNRVRVSARTGHLLPLPVAARILDDLTDPETVEAGDKDTPAEVVAKQTVDFVSTPRLETFEEELTRLYAPLDKRKRFPTYWY
ncbi:unnamed protein product [Dibothriocephalus latus]|uniref:Uncharacterized protein n=1 Tax=Dibothriocephalus latus TaxID=60516 RepID=A0A3P7LU45_DIBLA|nr:unnamed protein product [Dibothriocephalus latus]